MLSHIPFLFYIFLTIKKELRGGGVLLEFSQIYIRGDILEKRICTYRVPFFPISVYILFLLFFSSEKIHYIFSRFSNLLSKAYSIKHL